MVLRNIFRKDKVYSSNEKIDEYTVLNVLGEGRYGICYLVKKDDKQFIIKQLKKEMVKKTGFKVNFEEEILSKLEHECIPKFIKKLQFEKFLGYVLEFKEGKTFEELIFKDEYVFKRKEIYDIGIQIINIVKYLHSENIVHRDIRVPNTLYYQGKVNLVDFGLARWINDDRYTVDVDFSYFGDFLLHLYYSDFDTTDIKGKGKSWYDELELFDNEKAYLKKLLGIEERYIDINDVEKDLLSLYKNIENPL